MVDAAKYEPNPFNEGDTVFFSATVSDAQDQPNDVSLNWSLNGNTVSTQGATSSGTAEFSDTSLTFGSYNLVVTATDTDGLTDSDQINFTINGLPTQPVIRIDPDPADTNDDFDRFVYFLKKNNKSLPEDIKINDIIKNWWFVKF